ncbi:MAG: cytochrome b/b6 domain-containing protein [Flavobacterium sp.]
MRTRGEGYSLGFRLLHWGIAFVMLGLLVTILLRMTWLNRDSVSEIIKTYTLSQEVDMSPEQAVVLAKRIRQPMWDWHIYLGYVLCGLIFIRFITAIFGKIPFLNPFKGNITMNERFRAFVYFVFYISVIISLVTGIILKFDVEILPMIDFKKIHKASIYYFISFLVIHFLGVFLAELSSENGIISRMINGKSKYDL